MIDPQFWNDEPVVFHEDQHTEEIIASLADPDYARQWLAHNDELHELLYQQRRAADKKLAKALTLAALWRHSSQRLTQAHADELLQILTGE